MKLKFKNGYEVRVIDREGKSFKEIFEAAKRAIHKIDQETKDAELDRNVSTNISFSIPRIKKAIAEHNDNALVRELDFLKRDIETDNARHENYKNTFRKEVLEKIVDRYDEALAIFKPYLDETVVKQYSDMVDGLKEKWELIEVKTEDSKKIQDIPYFDPTDYPSIKNDDYSIERLKKEITRADYNEEADFGELEEVFKEINEFVEAGPQVLIDAGWDKLDARYAIDAKYGELLRLMRESKRDDIQKNADVLEDLIKKLKKAWDLIR